MAGDVEVVDAVPAAEHPATIVATLPVGFEPVSPGR
jgi:hypothetical protein